MRGNHQLYTLGSASSKTDSPSFVSCHGKTISASEIWSLSRRLYRVISSYWNWRVLFIKRKERNSLRTASARCLDTAAHLHFLRRCSEGLSLHSNRWLPGSDWLASSHRILPSPHQRCSAYRSAVKHDLIGKELLINYTWPVRAPPTPPRPPTHLDPISLLPSIAPCTTVHYRGYPEVANEWITLKRICIF